MPEENGKFFGFVIKKQGPPIYKNHTGVESKPFKRTNTLLLAQFKGDGGFLYCALKILGKDPREPTYICTPWKVVALCATYDCLAV